MKNLASVLFFVSILVSNSLRIKSGEQVSEIQQENSPDLTPAQQKPVDVKQYQGVFKPGQLPSEQQAIELIKKAEEEQAKIRAEEERLRKIQDNLIGNQFPVIIIKSIIFPYYC